MLSVGCNVTVMCVTMRPQNTKHPTPASRPASRQIDITYHFIISRHTHLSGMEKWEVLEAEPLKFLLSFQSHVQPHGHCHCRSLGCVCVEVVREKVSEKEGKEGKG